MSTLAPPCAASHPPRARSRFTLFGALAGSIVLSIAGACAPKREIKSQRLPDGSVRIICQTTLQVCLDSADLICKGKTYDVLRARDQREQFGAELGTSQVEVRTSEAVIRCSGAGTGEPDDEAELATTPPGPHAAPGPHGPGPHAPGPHAPAAHPATPPARVCVPGSTQACVGPGACEGGQSCLPTGTGFGPCDCGTIGAPVPAPSPPPTASSPSTPPTATPTPTPAPPLKPPPALAPPKKPKTPSLQPSATPLTPPSKAH